MYQQGHVFTWFLFLCLQKLKEFCFLINELGIINTCVYKNKKSSTCWQMSISVYKTPWVTAMIYGIMRAPLCRWPILIIMPSHLPVQFRSLVQSISSIPLAQSDSYFTPRVPLGKGCSVTLNQVSRTTV